MLLVLIYSFVIRMDNGRPISIDVWELLLLHHKPTCLKEKQDGDEILVKIIKKGRVLYVSLFCDASDVCEDDYGKELIFRHKFNLMHNDCYAVYV